MTRVDRCRYRAIGWALALLAASASAQEMSTPLLDDFRAVLPQLEAPLRAQLRRRAELWTQWAPAQRQAFAERAQAWDALTRGQRIAGRERYAAWQALPPPERAQVQAAARHFAGLPAEQQQALRARFAALDRSDRRGWLLGPQLGADYADLQPLLAQVPAAEHAGVLRTLRAMTPRQRDDLSVLVQRTPPQARAALRRELVSTAAANRDEWLWQRLQQL